MNMRIKLLAFALVFFGLPFIANAAALHLGGDFSLPTSERVSENIYLFSNTATIDGTVRGHLNAVGGVIDLSGTADGVTAVGGEVRIAGVVRGDARSAGALVTVTGSVSGDLVVLGGELFVAPSAVIGGDLIALSASTTIAGTVRGQTRLAAKTLVLSGTFVKDVEVAGSDISLASGAVLKGNLRYHSAEELFRAEDARVVGAIEWVRGEPFFQFPATGYLLGIGALLGLLMALVVTFVFLFMFREFTEDVVDETFSDFRGHLWKGALIAVAAPVLVVLLCVTVVGIPLGILLALFYAAGLIIAGIFAGVALGSFVTKRIFKRSEYEVTWKIVLGGTVLLFLLKAIPFVGIILSLLFMLPVLSAITRLFYEQMKGE